MKLMLICADEDEGVAAAVAEGGRLLEYHVVPAGERGILGNIYLGRVVNLEPAIQSAFVDIGEARSGFLHVSDVHPCYRETRELPWRGLRDAAPAERPPIQRLLRRGQELVCQVTKEAIGAKGPALTTHVSLAGRFMVLVAGMGRVGVSRRIADGEERERLRLLAVELAAGGGPGGIVRTAAQGCRAADLERDYQELQRLWCALERRARHVVPPQLIFQESDLVMRMVRDYLDDGVREIVVDSREVAQRLREFLEQTEAERAPIVRVHEVREPLFRHYGLQREIERVYDRRIPLPSGGSVVIEETEAMVAIDVNSGSSRQHADLEATALRTNLEAATEIGRQLRLRDIGGVVVVDFIDLVDEENRERLEAAVREMVREDRAKTWLAPLSRFGLLEMTRQRLRASKDRQHRRPCRECGGRGSVGGRPPALPEPLPSMIELLQQSETTSLDVDCGGDRHDQLCNELRRELVALEGEFGKPIRLLLDGSLAPDEVVLRARSPNSGRENGMDEFARGG